MIFNGIKGLATFLRIARTTRRGEDLRHEDYGCARDYTISVNYLEGISETDFPNHVMDKLHTNTSDWLVNDSEEITPEQAARKGVADFYRG